MFEKAFRQNGVEPTAEIVTKALAELRYKSEDDLYTALGEGNVTGRAIVEAVQPDVRRRVSDKIVQLTRRKPKPEAHPIPLKGLIPGMAVHFAGCCHPLPGERIVGIVTTGKGITVHTADCETLHTFEETPERWIDVSWDDDITKADAHVGRISVLVANQPGTLGSMSTIIAKQAGNISNLRIVTRSADFFEFLVDVEVRDVKHLTSIIAALRANPAVNAVERARG
jgi:GTP pyrophosphokinase